MTLEQIAYLAQIVGVVVVIGTVIYLSIQVRQGAELLRSGARQAAMIIDQEGIYRFIEYPEMGRIYLSKETPSFEDKVRLQMFIVSTMRTREFEWLQYRNGVLDEETWLSYRNVIFFALATERARALWDICAPNFNTEFVQMVANLIAGVPYDDYWERLDAVG